MAQVTSPDTIKLGPYEVDRDPARHQNPPLFVAEIGINFVVGNNLDDAHLRNALLMARIAVESGADIVKFQTHIPEAEMLPGHPLWDLLNRCRLDRLQHETIKEHTEESGGMFLSTPFSIEAADLLESIGVAAYKLGSGELTNLPLQEHVARFGKPMIVSTGMSTLEEVDRTANAICKHNLNLIMMNCTSSYPCAPQETRLHRIDALRDILSYQCGLPTPIGQSDHSPSVSSALGAIALGACVIEKHFTLDKNWPGPDQAASLLPGEFAEMVKMGREIWEGLADAGNGVLESEAGVRDWAEHRIVTICDIPRGARFTRDNITVKRTDNGRGLPASTFDELVADGGQYLARGMIKDYPVTLAEIAPRP